LMLEFPREYKEELFEESFMDESIFMIYYFYTWYGYILIYL